MDIKELREYLDHKTWLGRRIFGNYYRERCDLKNQQIQKWVKDIDADAFFIFDRNEDDIKLFWLVAKEVDSQEEELINAIENLRFCRPISLQYDFVKKVSSLTGQNLMKTFGIGSVADAYCLAKIKELDIARLTADLDDIYSIIFANAKQKTDLLRRNFSLLLESMDSHYDYINSANLNFRELVDRYVPKFGVKGLVEALKKANTSETELSAEENEVLALVYCTPYFQDDVDGIAPHIPGRLLSACIADRLAREQEFLENLRSRSGRFGDDDDDDASDEIEEILAQTHSPIYLDPTERCIIDVQHGTNPLYAHVYIEKFPQDDLNNSLPDFIRYKKGRLFTVEFVEDLKALDVADELNKRLNAFKYEMLRLEKACSQNQQLLHDASFLRQYFTMKRLYDSCFYIS